MSTSHLDGKRRGRGWPLPVLGASPLLLSLVLALGGGSLAVPAAGWYYVLLGIGLVGPKAQSLLWPPSGAWRFAAWCVVPPAWPSWDSARSKQSWIPHLAHVR